MTAGEAGYLQEKVQQWETWSAKVGLLENGAKAQVAAKSLKQRRELAAQFEVECLRNDALFLGVATRSRPRTDAEKEIERFQTAQARMVIKWREVRSLL